MTEERCGYTVSDDDGSEQPWPCDRPATGWRWYQDVEHEDCLAVACSFHSNEGGRRMHEMDVELRSLRGVVQAVEALAELSEKAIPGPWEYFPGMHGDPTIVQTGRGYFGLVATGSKEPADYGRDNARFIVGACNAVRAALAAAADAPQPKPAKITYGPRVPSQRVDLSEWDSHRPDFLPDCPSPAVLPQTPETKDQR